MHSLATEFQFHSNRFAITPGSGELSVGAVAGLGRDGGGDRVPAVLGWAPAPVAPRLNPTVSATAETSALAGTTGDGEIAASVLLDM